MRIPACGAQIPEILKDGAFHQDFRVYPSKFWCVNPRFRFSSFLHPVDAGFIVAAILLYPIHEGAKRNGTTATPHRETASYGLRREVLSPMETLALFSFVGFESATTLGAEARIPLKTIPHAVIQSALLAGAIFTLCAYTEVLGLRAIGQDLDTSQAPMRGLAKLGGIPVLGLLIDIGALVSMFAGTLACITAGARVLLLMSHNGLAHEGLRTTHRRNETPGRAIIVTGIAAGLPVAILAARGASGLDVYGWMGSLATYGFIVAYALVSLALPGYLRSHGAPRASAQLLSGLACAAMLLALMGNL